ncbi:hypothetical protein IFR05_002919 [Cadophora sp. M221]|nr:hypothetical protein IFR05_002919 [Cadophora sp. M221]
MTTKSVAVPVHELLGSIVLELENVRKMAKFLIDLDHEDFRGGSIRGWVTMLSLKPPAARYTLPLGHFGGVEHWLAIESLGPFSLNCADPLARNILRDTLVGITFKSSTGLKEERRAIPVGRVIAAKNGISTVFQSRWVVLYDQIKSLWACYANDVAPIDKEPLRPDYVTRRYHEDFSLDIIFGAVRSNGQLVVHLGKIDHMQFRMVELNAIKVESASWLTHQAKVFNNGDLDQPIHPIGFQRLRSVNTRDINQPNYKKQDIADKSPKPHISRRSFGQYYKYDAAKLSKKFPGKEMMAKKHMLFMALTQRSGFNFFKRSGTDPDIVTSKGDVEAYWKMREKLSPGLDIVWIPDDQLVAEVAEPEDTEMGDVGEVDAGEADVGEHVVPENEQILLVQRPLTSEKL